MYYPQQDTFENGVGSINDYIREVGENQNWPGKPGNTNIPITDPHAPVYYKQTETYRNSRNLALRVGIGMQEIIN